ncbi:MAG: hypothetical protein C4517_13310 [Stygiobacter sp.]|nr:MAG: hypothetical protein C4517_13310 [Stygiobacter sp.]
MQQFDLAIAYTWEYDEEFIELIEKIFQSEGYTTFLIKPTNYEEVIHLLETRKLHFSAYLDRASDEDPAFMPIAQILQRRKSYIINPYQRVNESVDKAIIHKRLQQKRFRLPKTFILPAFDHDFRPHINPADLDFLKRPFIIKPSYFSGGGQGVIKNAETLDEIRRERIKSPTEKYLVQEIIHPKRIHGRRAWFRVIWAFDQAIPTWWDDHSHVYFPVTKKDLEKYNLTALKKITARVAKLTGLDYFSSEIAITRDHTFYLIDYVNDQCDMRLKSNHPDGVPDVLVKQFIQRMLAKVALL